MVLHVLCEVKFQVTIRNRVNEKIKNEAAGEVIKKGKGINEKIAPKTS